MSSFLDQNSLLSRRTLLHSIAVVRTWHLRACWRFTMVNGSVVGWSASHILIEMYIASSSSWSEQLWLQNPRLDSRGDCPECSVRLVGYPPLSCGAWPLACSDLCACSSMWSCIHVVFRLLGLCVQWRKWGCAAPLCIALCVVRRSRFVGSVSNDSLWRACDCALGCWIRERSCSYLSVYKCSDILESFQILEEIENGGLNPTPRGTQWISESPGLLWRPKENV